MAESDKTAIELEPGQISLHHGLTIHGSGPNASDDRRIACVIRYLRPDMKQEVGEKDYAALLLSGSSSTGDSASGGGTTSYEHGDNNRSSTSASTKT